MEVVWHQTIRVELNPEPFTRFAQQDQKRCVIKRFGEDDLLVIAAIDDVKDAAWRHDSISFGHRLYLLCPIPKATPMPPRSLTQIEKGKQVPFPEKTSI